MVDHLSREGRSRVMAAIRAKNTKPELAVRAALREAGATGYRLHLRSLPGRPDIAFTRWKVAVFIDGVFWHGHPAHFNPEKASTYWKEKIARNQQRDRETDEQLQVRGWVVRRFWDLDVKVDLENVTQEIIASLRDAGWRNGTLSRDPKLD